MPDRAVGIFIEDLMRRRRMIEAGQNCERGSALFDGMSEGSLQALLSRSHLREYPAATQIVQQGDRPDSLFCILSGKIKTNRISQQGGEAVIRMLGKGDTFMDVVLFMGGVSPIGATAVEDSRLLMIPAAAVHDKVLKDSQFSCNLLRIAARHYKTAMQQIDSISTRSPVQRIGYYLLQLHLQNGHANTDMTLPFRKTMIASHLGMTPETLSRALKQMSKSGVEIDREVISLRDAYALCHFCDTDTASICDNYRKDGCPCGDIADQRDEMAGEKG